MVPAVGGDVELTGEAGVEGRLDREESESLDDDFEEPLEWKDV